MKRIVSLKHVSKKTTTHHNHTFKTFYTFPKTPSTNPTLLQNQKGYNCPCSTNNGLLSKFSVSKYSSSSSTNHVKSEISSVTGPGILIRSQFPKRFNVSPNGSSSSKRNWSSRDGKYSVDDIVLGLIVTNSVVFVLWRELDCDFMLKHFTISGDNITSGRIHTLITYAFSHVDTGHLASNIFGLFVFGTSMGRYFGPKLFLRLYFGGAVMGSSLYIAHQFILRAKYGWQQGTLEGCPTKTPALGASGAVNAVMLLHIFLFPKATMMVNFLIPVPAILLGIYLIGKDIVRMLGGAQKVSGAIHLGGAGAAATLWLRIMNPRGFRF